MEKSFAFYIWDGYLICCNNVLAFYTGYAYGKGYENNIYNNVIVLCVSLSDKDKTGMTHKKERERERWVTDLYKQVWGYCTEEKT